MTTAPPATAAGRPTDVGWPTAVDVPGPGGVDLWLLDLTALAPGWGPRGRWVLDAGERARAQAFVQPLERVRYIGAHIMLRRILGAYLGRPPHEVALTREPCLTCEGGPHGRPVLADRPAGPHFSLSHGGGLALLGVAGTRVGVDVEPLPEATAVSELLWQLHPGERIDLGSEVPARRAAHAGRIWARKEAYLKGLGTGLGRELNLDYLGERGTAARPAGWSLFDLPLPGAHAACALRRPEGTAAVDGTAAAEGAAAVRGFGRLAAEGL